MSEEGEARISNLPNAGNRWQEGKEDLILEGIWYKFWHQN